MNKQFPYKKIQDNIHMMTFNHSGHLGDILFSLYFCTELAYFLKQPKYNYHIQTNVKDQIELKHPNGNVRMTKDSVEFVKPLLISQPYINNVTYGDTIPDKCINMDLFRKLPINFSAGDIRNWYYNFAHMHLPREFCKAIIYVSEIDTKYKDKIMFSQTERYQNVTIDFLQLKRFENHLVFVGTPEQHERFCRLYFHMEYCPVKNMYELAKYMNGAKGFCAGQCGLYSLAECMKVPRIMIAPEYIRLNGEIILGPHNNHPLGGWCEDVSTTEKLVYSMDALMER